MIILVHSPYLSTDFPIHHHFFDLKIHSFNLLQGFNLFQILSQIYNFGPSLSTNPITDPLFLTALCYANPITFPHSSTPTHNFPLTHHLISFTDPITDLHFTLFLSTDPFPDSQFVTSLPYADPIIGSQFCAPSHICSLIYHLLSFTDPITSWHFYSTSVQNPITDSHSFTPFLSCNLSQSHFSTSLPLSFR